MNYFVFCKTQQEAKAHYHQLAKKHHPDKGGDAQTFDDIKKQYESFKPFEEPSNPYGGSNPFEWREYRFNFNQTKVPCEECRNHKLKIDKLNGLVEWLEKKIKDLQLTNSGLLDSVLGLQDFEKEVKVLRAELEEARRPKKWWVVLKESLKRKRS